MLGVTVGKQDWLKVIYKNWMKVAHVIGNVVTTVILGIIFYVVFAPVGIFLRLRNKDLLDRALDPNAASYWNQRERKAFDPKCCLKQY